MKLKKGDICIYQNNSIISVLIRFLISLSRGIPFRLAKNHIDNVYDDIYNISAEYDKVKLVSTKKIIEETKHVKVFRFKKFWTGTGELLRKHDEISNKILKEQIRYGYWRYALDSWRIIMFLLGISKLGKFIIGRESIISILIVFVAFLIVEFLLEKYDKKTQDCGETASRIIEYVGLMCVPNGNRTAIPNNILQVLETLVLFDIVEVVFEK